jgi:serine/threonine-protein kinase RsbT
VSAVKIKQIKEILGATVLEGPDNLEIEVSQVYASDLMSDVLAFGKPHSILFTGLATQQAIISAHMAEFKAVVLVRGKKPNDNSVKMARDTDLILMSTDLDMFDACVRADSIQKGKALSSESVSEKAFPEELLLAQELVIEGDDFASAGMVSTGIKSTLKKIGLDNVLIRRIAISTYEAEMNVVMHADKGKVFLTVTPTYVKVVIADQGKGIPDVESAMVEGFSTATEEMRAMGFGAGMGLSNINRNADEFEIQSEVGVGTTLNIKFLI